MIIIRTEKDKITNVQLIFIITGFTIGSSLVLPPGSTLGTKAWMAVILGFIEALLFLWVYSLFPKKFGNEKLNEIFNKVYGKVIGSILFLAFVLYIIHLGALVIRNFMDFIGITMMPTTPLWVIGIAVMSTCAYASFKGISVIARNSQILVPLTVLAVGITIVLLYKDMDHEYFLPVLDLDLKKLAIASYDAASFPFGDIVAFLFVYPYLTSFKDVSKSTIKGALFGGLVILVVVLRNIAVLGFRLSVATFPSAQAVRLINIAGVVTRLEIIIFFNLITMGFIKISILLWGAAKGVSYLFKINNFKIFVIPFAILMLLIASYQFGNLLDVIKFNKDIYPPFRTFFQAVLPVLTLLVAKIRKII